MKKLRTDCGRALFYSRDSGGRHEMAPGEYVEWARRETTRLGLQFDGTAEAIEGLIRNGRPVAGDIHFDYCVQGHLMSRPGLDLLRETARTDVGVSHIFIPLRERLARPGDPLEGVLLEQDLRELGITLIFMNQVLAPLRRGRRRNIAETLTALFEYEQSGKFRQELAEKMIYAQIRLARHGYSTGGRPPFGFRRALVGENGQVVRKLDSGEVVRRAGHHVVWIPGVDAEIELIQRILSMLMTMPASRVATTLNEEGIPSPDAGRVRTDNGVKHTVSGSWHSSTIVNIARHPLIRALTSYGRRSMGDQRRMTPEGPRELEDHENTLTGKPKVIRNTEQGTILTRASFEPLISAQESERLLKILDDRAGTQRGKPRSRDPNMNPLGGRIYDIACTWLMYRVPRGKSFHYTCGQYQQTRPRKCAHNHVDGLVATQFVLASLRQRLLSPRNLSILERKLRERVAAAKTSKESPSEVAKARAELAAVRAQRERAAHNLALAKDEEQFRAVSLVFDELGLREQSLVRDVAKLESAQLNQLPSDDVVESAMGLLRKLPDLAGDDHNLGAVGELFRTLNVQLYLRFRPVRKKKRIENKQFGGVLTWGDAQPPIQRYNGPTGRPALAAALAASSCSASAAQHLGETEPILSDTEDQSLGNVSRGDRI